MPKKLFNLRHQIRSEASTEEKTRQEIPNWFLNYPKALDSLFEVAYFIGSAKDATSPEGHFYSVGDQILVQLPYTIRATHILVEKGFYFEAISLVRNLFESFVQLRYFHNHHESIKSHIMGEKVISFKTMFEEIAPGFYDKIYAKQLSIFAHSRLASSIFRTQYSASGTGTTTMGSQFDEDGCTYSIWKIIAILSGALNCIPILFPQYSGLVPDATETKRKESLT